TAPFTAVVIDDHAFVAETQRSGAASDRPGNVLRGSCPSIKMSFPHHSTGNSLPISLCVRHSSTGQSLLCRE
ncbi:hypothetical protein, partial [Methylobacterium aquaticum]|uniref:hypothetical protein n=1 Tax=Methylobacterium aquaticum TaxID=270351 RepID=UPI001AEC32B5